MLDQVIKYLANNWIEIIGAILSLIYLYLSIKQKLSLWFFGFFSSAFYIVVFYKTGFYADMSLQFYYLIISIYGWIYWTKGTQNMKHEMPVSKINLNLTIKLIVASILIYFTYYFILKNFTDSTIPKADSLVGMLSIIGTWLLAKKYIENWLVWIFADGLAIGLFLYKGLYPTAILFSIYTLMSIIGYFQWKRE